MIEALDYVESQEDCLLSEGGCVNMNDVSMSGLFIFIFNMFYYYSHLTIITFVVPATYISCALDYGV